MVTQTHRQDSHGRPAFWTRAPERLVLQGYRQSLGAAEQDGALEALYLEELGGDDARTAMAALRDFVATLDRCARCPLHRSPARVGAPRGAETLILGLIAGLQHGDDDAVERCLRALACPVRCAPVAHAAATFAFILRGLDLTLLPARAWEAAGAGRDRAPQDVVEATCTVH